MISESPIASAAIASSSTASATSSNAVFPSATDVISGTSYGPTGADYTGTLVSTSESAKDIAAVIWQHKLALNAVNFIAIK
jgi:hypothetical protein